MRHLLVILLFITGFSPSLFSQAAEPTVPVSNVLRGLTNCLETAVQWTSGNGNARIIVMRAGAPVSELPRDGQTYTANSQFGQGTDLGNGNFVVYIGSGNSTTITGLQHAIDYHFAIFEFNGNGANTNYLTSVYPAWNIPVPPALQLSASVTDVSCYNYGDGAIRITISGGTTPYSYQWNTGDTTDSLVNIDGGTYSVTITDSAGCSISAGYTVQEPDPITYTLTTKNITCPNGSDGSAFISVQGGTPPFTFSWNTGATGSEQNGLSAGTYTVTLTDAGGCSYDTTFTLTAPPAFDAKVEATAASCWNTEDGAINLNVSGATPPYAYAWADGGNSPQRANLSPGAYQVTITDNNGCTYQQEVTVAAPDSIRLRATVTDVSCEGNADGSIELNPVGGTPGYAYSWNTNETAAGISSLSTGNYSATVTDQNGCEVMADFIIAITDDPRGCLDNLTFYEIFTPNGDGVNEVWIIDGLVHYPENQLEIFNRWGQPVYSQQNYQNNWDGSTAGGPLPQGTYYYILTIPANPVIRLSGDITLLR